MLFALVLLLTTSIVTRLPGGSQRGPGLTIMPTATTTTTTTTNDNNNNDNNAYNYMCIYMYNHNTITN